MTAVELDRWLDSRGVHLRVSCLGGVYAASVSSREDRWEERVTVRATGAAYSAALAAAVRLWDAEGPRPGGRARLRVVRPNGAGA